MTTDVWAEWRSRQVPAVGPRISSDRSYWRRRARAVISEVMPRLPPEATRDAANRALRDAYPFGERAMWPYRCWLAERSIALHMRFGRQ